MADPAEETAEEQQTDVQGNTATIDKQMLESGDKKDEQSNKEFEMSSLKVRKYKTHRQCYRLEPEVCIVKR